MEKPVMNQDILSLCKELGVKSPINLVGRKIYFSYISPSDNTNVHVCSSISKVTFEHKSMIIFLNEDSYPFPRRILNYFFQEKKWAVKRTVASEKGFKFEYFLEKIVIYKKRLFFN